MARPAPPSDDGSPARLIATMVGIVGILLLGSLAWSAVGALLSAVGSAGSALSSAAAPPPPPTLAPAAAVTPMAAASPTAAAPTPTLVATVVASPTPASTPIQTPQLNSTPTAVVAGRNPWILLPQPEPGAKVPPGPIVLEARGRGDVPISSMRLELDGSALPVALEQRSESTWRGSASTRVSTGQHSARATVTDADGRTGSFRWTFTVAPAP